MIRIYCFSIRKIDQMTQKNGVLSRVALSTDNDFAQCCVWPFNAWFPLNNHTY